MYLGGSLSEMLFNEGKHSHSISGQVGIIEFNNENHLGITALKYYICINSYNSLHEC